MPAARLTLSTKMNPVAHSHRGLDEVVGLLLAGQRSVLADEAGELVDVDDVRVLQAGGGDLLPDAVLGLLGVREQQRVMEQRWWVCVPEPFSPYSAWALNVAQKPRYCCATSLTAMRYDIVLSATLQARRRSASRRDGPDSSCVYSIPAWERLASRPDS